LSGHSRLRPLNNTAVLAQRSIDIFAILLVLGRPTAHLDEVPHRRGAGVHPPCGQRLAQHGRHQQGPATARSSGRPSTP